MEGKEERVLAALDRERLIQITTNLADIVSISGDERPLAEYLGEEMARLGMRVAYQEVEPERPNVIGELKGSGKGATLMFCGHMDHFDQPEPTQVVGDRIYGRGLVNMKCAFSAYIMALAMLQKAGIALVGDILIAGVVGEIEKAPIGQYQGRTYRGGGVGARYLMDHGVTADMCIIGEPTGLQLQIGNEGYVLAKITVSSPTDFVGKAFQVAQAVKAWEAIYQQKYRHDFMLPTAQVGALEGGHPYKPGVWPVCHLYVVVRTPPGVPPMAIRRELEALCEDAMREEPEVQCSVELYMSTDGYEISKEEYIVKAMEQAHQRVFGEPVPYAPPIRYAITSDGSRIAPYGVPTVTYGAGFGTHLVDPTEPKKEAALLWDTASGVRRGVGITNLIRCTQVYALAALDICTKTREKLRAQGGLRAP